MRTILFLLLLLPSCTESVYAQAVWGNRTYNHPVCSNRNCQMCYGPNGIAAQLQAQSWHQTTTIQPQLHSTAHTTSTQTHPSPSSSPTNQSTQHYQLVSVPYTVQVKRCNGRTCWYENETRYRSEYRLTTNPVQSVAPTAYTPSTKPNLLYVTTLAPTPEEAVAELLRIANPQPNEVLYDIGCGDGRILIAASTAYNCRSVGIELNPESAKLAQSQINIFGLTDLIRVYEGDALKFTYEHADVVTMYLYPELMERILPLLKPKTRVVSYLHSIPGAKEHRVGEHVFYEWTTQ